MTATKTGKRPAGTPTKKKPTSAKPTSSKPKRQRADHKHDAPAAKQTTRKRTPGKPSNGYSAADIKELAGIDAVRVRPAMYVGDTQSRGLTHLLVELIDNAVDEAAEGHGDRIDVTCHADGSYEVGDAGRGIPVDVSADGKRTALEVVMTSLHAGGKFGSDSYAAAGGLHGVGASVVNALSDRVDVEVDRDGYTHRMSFHERTPGQRDASDNFKATSKLAKTKLRRKRTGTRVRFWPDFSLFDADARVNTADVEAKLQHTAWLLPGVTLTLTDHTDGDDEPRVVEFRSDGGLVDALDAMRAAEPVTPPLVFTGETEYVEQAAAVTDDGSVVREQQRRCVVDVAMQWTATDQPQVVSFVNTIPTPDGGTHQVGFVRSVAAEVRAAVKAAGLRKLAGKTMANETAQQDDALAGLCAVLRVRIAEPRFAGQTKRELSTAQATNAVRDVLRPTLKEWFSGNGKHSSQKNVTAVVNHVADAMIERVEAARAASSRAKLRKLSAAGLPAKLADCRQHPNGELLIVEGDSAAGPAKRARDATFQAVLPLRGKIVNAAKASLDAVASNAEAAALIAAVGAGTGRSFDISQARYQRIVMLTDADVDGGHIRCLLLTLLWTRMRDLVTAGRVFSANPPTHAVITGRGEKTFVYSETEKDAMLAKHPNARVTRFKGLGEMDDDELRRTTLDPATRTLRRVTVDDAQRAYEAVRQMMGDDVAERRTFLARHSPAYRDAVDA